MFLTIGMIWYFFQYFLTFGIFSVIIFDSNVVSSHDSRVLYLFMPAHTQKLITLISHHVVPYVVKVPTKDHWMVTLVKLSRQKKENYSCVTPSITVTLSNTVYTIKIFQRNDPIEDVYNTNWNKHVDNNG